MTRLRENKRILVFLCCISILYACVLVADTASETGPAAVTFKYLGDLCCLLVVLVSWKNAYDRRDVGLLLAAFLFIMGADALFLFARQLEWGILCYCFAHLALIRRYRGKAFGRGSAAALAALAFYLIGQTAGWRLPYVYILSVVYSGLLFLDLYYGFLSDLPRPNKTLVQVGMVLFLLNDANNAVMYLCPPGSPGHVVSAYLVWMFYFPALILLSLSAYGYTQKEECRS